MKRLYRIFFLALTVAVGYSLQAQQVSACESNVPSTTSNGTNYTSISAQVFTATCSGTLKSVSIAKDANGSSLAYSMSIVAVYAGTSTAVAPLVSKNYANSALPTAGTAGTLANMAVDFSSSNLQITAGQQYLIFYASQGNMAFSYSGDTYSTGYGLYYSGPNTLSALGGSSDYIFEVKITLPPQPPVFESATAFTFAENGTGIAADVNANNGDGGSTDSGVTFAISGGQDLALFDINSTTGEITFKNSPDYDNPLNAMGDNVYALTVKATDSQGDTFQDITISVTDAKPTTGFGPGPVINPWVTENDTYVEMYMRDENQPFNANITMAITGGVDADKFEIGNNGLLYFITAPDYENSTANYAENIYEVFVETSNVHNTKTSYEAYIEVTNANPQFDDVFQSGSHVDENTTVIFDFNASDEGGPADQGITYSISGYNADLFIIDPQSGVLSTLENLNYENPVGTYYGGTGYHLFVYATAGDNQSGIAVIIIVDNVNEPPVDIQVSNVYVDENVPFGTYVGAITVTDPEDPNQNGTYTYEVLTTVPFAGVDYYPISIQNGNIYTNLAIIDYELLTDVAIEIKVTDGGGLSFTKSINFYVNDLVETLTWTGTGWNNGYSEPTIQDNAIVDASYYGSITCANLTINADVTAYITGTLEVTGDVVVNGALNIASGASLITYAGGDFTGVANIERNTRYADGRYSFVGSPVTAASNIKGADLGTWVYAYDETKPYGASGISRWIDAKAMTLMPGEGYAQAGKQKIVFSGQPNAGTITVAGSYTQDTDDANEGFNLVANPYAAAISYRAFMADNANNNGTIYLWDDNGSDQGRGNNSDYIAVNASGSVNSTAGNASRFRGFLGSAQGFFVKLDGSGNNDIVFTESQRSPGGNGDENFFRTAQEINRVRLNLTTTDGLFRQALIAWNNDVDDATINRMYDAEIFNSHAEYALFTQKLNVPLAIHTVTTAVESIWVGLNIAQAGAYTLSLDQSEFSGYLYLQDHLTGETVDLMAGSYTFSSAAGSITDRFELVTSRAILGFDQNTSWNIYASGKTLHLQPSAGAAPRAFSIYNLGGQQVASAYADRSMELSLAVPAGVYIVTDGQLSTKVVIK